MKQTTKINNWLLRFDRTFSGKIWWQIFILLVFAAVALIIGLGICYFLEFGKNGQRVPFYEWALYLLVDSNALNNIYIDEYQNGERPSGTSLF